MEFTTNLELHSQTTRLIEGVSQRGHGPAGYGNLTLYVILFQGTWTGVPPETPSTNYNSDAEDARFQI